MKKEKQSALIKLLREKNDWVKANILATQFSVSTRTIRKYVNEINENSTYSPLIMSSKFGYKLNESAYQKTLDKIRKDLVIPETPRERLYYLIKSAILNVDGIDIFELSEELFVSTSTVENDLKKATDFLDEFKLSFKRNGYLITINGLEQNKRKLMSHIFYKESNNDFINLDSMQEAFYNYDLKKFKAELVTILATHNLYVNEYTMGNILLHIVIATERIKNQRTVSKENINQVNNLKEYKAALEIVALIESQFGVTFDKPELYYLTVLLISKTTILQYDNLTKDNLNEYIEEHYIRLVDEIVQKVNDYYLIDIYDDELLVNFTLHIRNLVTRARHNYPSRNPLTRKIKSTYPLIFDLAVFISNVIQKREQIFINEDEITYIAFHIGVLLERKKRLENKVICTVVCPGYYNMHVGIARRIEQSLGEHIEINKIVTTVDIDFKQLETDIVITTIEITSLIDAEIVKIQPFPTDEDLQKIHRAILDIKKMRSRTQLKNHLMSLFKPQLFQRNLYLTNEYEMIQSIGEKMVKLEFITPNFIDDVIEREKMSSTAFNNNVAVPHSMHMNALKSSISIVLNDKPIKWGEYRVRIIAFIAINKNDRGVFRDIYDDFIATIAEPENVTQLLQSKSYDSFIDSLVILMSNHPSE